MHIKKIKRFYVIVSNKVVIKYVPLRKMKTKQKKYSTL